MSTYHGIVRISCLACGFSTTNAFTMEEINDVSGCCPACNDRTRLRMEIEDGTAFMADPDA